MFAGNEITYDEMHRLLNKILNKYDLTSKSDVFEETLCLLAGVSRPTACKFGPNEATKGAFTNFDLGLTLIEAQKFKDYFCNYYGDSKAQLFTDPKDRVALNGQLTYFIRLTSDVIAKRVLPEFEWKLKAILENDKETYSRYLKQCDLNLIDYNKAFADIFIHGSKLGIDHAKTDFVEETLLKLANITNKPSFCRFEKDKLITQTNFYFGIPILDAQQLVSFLNKHFDDAAELTHTDVTKENKTGIQVIRVKNRAILSMNQELNNLLDVIAKNDIDTIEAYRIASGSIKLSKRLLVDKLEKFLQQTTGILSSMDQTSEQSKYDAPSTNSVYRGGISREPTEAVNLSRKFESLSNTDNSNVTIKVEKAKPDLQKDAEEKLAKTLNELKDLVAKSASKEEVDKASEKLTGAIYFYKYACETNAERGMCKKFFQNVKQCQKEINAYYKQSANPDSFALNMKQSYPATGLVMNTSGPVYRC